MRCSRPSFREARAAVSPVRPFGCAAARLAVLVVAAVACAAPARAQELSFVRFSVAGPAALDSVRRLGVDVVSVRPRSGAVDVDAVVSPGDRAALAARGWLAAAPPRSPAAAALEARRAQLGAGAFTVYRDFDDPARGVAAYLRSFAASRANVTLDSIGASYQGRPILAVKVGPAADGPARPNVLFMATYHAREWAATETALRLVAWLADSLPLQPGGAALLAARDVWVVPVVNPDGYQYTFQTTRLWRKNRRLNADASFGVDLNRNHAAQWGRDDVGSSGTPASEVYRGSAPESEPEIQAVVRFHAQHPPVVSVSFHTFTGAVLYPWGHANGVLTGDDGVFRALAGTDLAPVVTDRVPGSSLRYYHPGPSWHLYPTNGEYAAWAYQAHRTAAFTVELTAGCCVAGSSYGFEFPDDDAMLAQLFTDNLPFALSLLRAAADPTATPAPPATQFESVWPEVRVLVPSPAGAATLEIATDPGALRSAALTPDSLGAGRYFTRLISRDPRIADARGVRLAAAGLDAEFLLRDGAESAASDSAWSGWSRVGPGAEGSFAWSSQGRGETLTSPAVAVSGRGGLALYFWTSHAGSLFAQDLRGRVEVQADGGPWVVVHEIIGAAPEWYPVAVPLPAMSGAARVRVRFVAATNFIWNVDAVAITTSDARLFASGAGRARRAPAVEVSANPVRQAPVTIRWPAGTGTARVDVLSLLGTRVVSVTLTNDPGRWQWDLMTTSGEPVASGPYVVVVSLGDGTHLRRRLIVAR